MNNRIEIMWNDYLWSALHGVDNTPPHQKNAYHAGVLACLQLLSNATTPEETNDAFNQMKGALKNHIETSHLRHLVGEELMMKLEPSELKGNKE